MYAEIGPSRYPPFESVCIKYVTLYLKSEIDRYDGLWCCMCATADTLLC